MYTADSPGSAASGFPTATSSAGHSAHVLRDAVAFVRSHAAWTLLCGVVGALVFSAYAATRTPTFQAEARLVVHQGAAAGLGELSALAALTGATPSAAEVALLESRSVALRVLRSPDGERPATPDRPGYSQHMDLCTSTRDTSLTPLALLKRRYFGPREFEVPSDHPRGRLFAAAERLQDDAPGEVRAYFPSADRVRLSRPDRFSRLGLGSDGEPTEFAFEAGQPLDYLGLRLWLEPLGAIAGQSYFVRHLAPYKGLRDLVKRRRIREDPPKSGILSVLVEDTDPHRAAETANAICQNFLDLRLQRNSERSSATTDFLDELLVEHVDASRDIQARVVELQTANPMLVNPEGASGSFMQQITTLERERATLSLKRSALAKIVEDIEQGNPYALSRLDAATVSTGLNADPITSQLLEEIARIRGTTAEAGATRSPLHADVAGGLSAIQDLEAQVLEQLRGRLTGFESQIHEVERAVGDFEQGLAAMPREQRELIGLLAQLESQAEIVPFLGRALQAARIQDVSATKQVELVDPASAPDGTFAPSVPILVLIGALLGAGFGLMASNLRQVATAAGSTDALALLPTLAVVPRGRSKRRASWSPLRDEPYGAVAQSLRQLRSALGPELDGAYGVTSTVRREGRSLVALGLAQALAATDRRVLLIDADRAHAALAELLQAPAAPTLPAALPQSDADGVSSDDPPPPLATDTPGLDLYAAGEDASPDRFASRSTAQLLSRLRERYDCVVVDLPPVAEGTDACTLGAHLDATLFVHRPRRTNDPDAALELLRAAHVVVAGVVRNNG